MDISNITADMQTREHAMNDELFERDWRFITDAILEMNAEEDIRRSMRSIIESLFVLIPSDQVMFTHMARADQFSILPTYVDYVGMEALFLDKFLNEEAHYNDDPYFRYCNVFKDTRCFLDSETMTDEYRKSTRLYKEIYEPQGIYYGLRAYLVYKGETVANISIFNSKERGDFSRRDKLILDTLAPHIALRLGAETVLEQAAGTSETPAHFEDWGLTAREQEIANLVIKGMEDYEIADSLCIAKSTFKKHIYNIYQKLDVNNRVQLYAALTKGK